MIPTPNNIQSQVVSAEYNYLDAYTVCTITTNSGVKLCGTSSCLGAMGYDRAIGEQMAFDRAIDVLRQLEGHMLSQGKSAECSQRPSA